MARGDHADRHQGRDPKVAYTPNARLTPCFGHDGDGIGALDAPYPAQHKRWQHDETLLDEGGANWAAIASLVETCKLNGVEPQAYFTDLLTRLVNGWPQARIDELMPWHWATPKGG